MTSSYGGHDAAPLVESAAPSKMQYRHLESNDALSNPTRLTGTSEAQVRHTQTWQTWYESCEYPLPSFSILDVKDSYYQLLEGEGELAGHMQGLKTERLARQRNNKTTHFHLGFDCKDNVSEQVRADCTLLAREAVDYGSGVVWTTVCMSL